MLTKSQFCWQKKNHLIVVCSVFFPKCVLVNACTYSCSAVLCFLSWQLAFWWNPPFSFQRQHLGLSKNYDINHMFFSRRYCFFSFIVFPSAGFTPASGNSYCGFFVGCQLTTISFTSVFLKMLCLQS